MISPSDLQPELKLRERAARTTVNTDSIAELCGLLRGRGWVTRRELQRQRPHWSERFIRELASCAGRVVSGPGTPGYCLVDEVTDEDLEHAGRSNIAQGREMARRGIRLLRILALRRKAKELSEETRNAERGAREMKKA